MSEVPTQPFLPIQLPAHGDGATHVQGGPPHSVSLAHMPVVLDTLIDTPRSVSYYVLSDSA